MELQRESPSSDRWKIPTETRPSDLPKGLRPLVEAFWHHLQRKRNPSCESGLSACASRRPSALPESTRQDRHQSPPCSDCAFDESGFIIGLREASDGCALLPQSMVHSRSAAPIWPQAKRIIAIRACAVW
jgi:hypothetical protein